jgi:hypothetical protein
VAFYEPLNFDAITLPVSFVLVALKSVTRKQGKYLKANLAAFPVEVRRNQL